MTEIIKTQTGYASAIDGMPYVSIPSVEGMEDTLEVIENGA